MVDEDISRRTIALSIRTGKLTARTLAWALRAAGRKIQKGTRKGYPAQGQQRNNRSEHDKTRIFERNHAFSLGDSCFFAENRHQTC